MSDPVRLIMRLTKGSRMKRIPLQVGLVFALLLSAVSPAAAHLRSANAGGLCPHSSSSSHANGAFVAVLSPSGWGQNDSTCLRSRLKVRGLDIDGSPPGWQTAKYYGDPGKMQPGFADDVSWTKHDVLINVQGIQWWGGLTLWH